MMNNNAFDLSNKTIMVTGGTRGIGKAISIRFAEAGASVFAVYVRDQAAAGSLTEKAESEGLQIQCLQADLTRPSGMEAIANHIARENVTLSGLVFSAATGVHKTVDKFTARDIRWVFSLNIEAFIGLVSMLLPNMEEGSTIVALSSKGATHAVPSYGLVGASKGALEAYSRQLAAELALRRIRVNIITPGAVLTEAWTALPDRDERLAASVARTPLGRLVTAEEVAYTAQFLCSGASSGIVGHKIVVDGGGALLE